MAEDEGKIESDIPTEVTIHYLKSNLFRTVHCDGAIGGPTPQGNISMGIFSERGPIPLQIKHQIKPDRTLGDEIERSGRDGMVREVETEVILSLYVATKLRDWLTDNIDKVQAIRDTAEKMREEASNGT